MFDFFNNKMASLTTTTTFKDRFAHSVTPTALRTYLAEFISTFLFVFVAIGSTMSAHKLMAEGMTDPSCLVAIAIANAFALSSAVYISAGGHVNPAVTFGMAVGGHISIPSAIFYWIMQLAGSVMACLLLRVGTAGHAIPTHKIAVEMTGFGASVLEGVLTFALVYTVYAASDTRRGSLLGGQAIGPIAIGFIAGGNVLAAGPFTGGSMNPACSFGVALISGSFKNQAVYWVGPLIGGGIAGLLYDNVVFPPQKCTGDSSRDIDNELSGASVGF